MNLEEIVKLSESERYSYPDIFDINIGLDIVLPEKGLHATPINSKRSAVLLIDSFVGFSSEAIHYYGIIEIDGVYMTHDDDENLMTCVSEKDYPLAASRYKLSLHRYITQKEIDEDKDRWSYYDAGDLTKCFDSQEDLINFSKEVFRARFSGDWEFYFRPFQSNQLIKIEL